MKRIILQPGDRFGRLEVVSFHSVKGKYTRWLCRCDCGNEAIGDTYALNRGSKRSCGCLLSETNRRTKTKHGHAQKGNTSSEYKTWGNMRDRCYQPKHISYPRYGGRGIRVCDRWREGEDGKTGFECFLEDMGPRPSPQHSLDRHPDYDGDYGPGNCRWATATQQARNTSSVHFVEWKGTKVCLTELCENLGLNYGRVLARLTKYGYSLEDAITKPSRRAA